MSAIRNAPDTNWRSRGLCLQRADIDWCPDKGAYKGRPRADYSTAIKAAKAVCRVCPVYARCEEWILGVDEGAAADGVFAAMTGAERKAARKAKNARPEGTTLRDRCADLAQRGVDRRSIAERLGISTNAVAAHLAQARKETAA